MKKPIKITTPLPRRPLACTACGDLIEPETRYMVIYELPPEAMAPGYVLYEACEHTDAKIRQLVAIAPPVGIAGSMECLGEIIVQHAAACKHKPKAGVN